MAELIPNDPNYDNGPAIRERIENNGICRLDSHTYHVDTVIIDRGVCGKLVGVSSGYRNIHTGLTQLAPIAGWTATNPLLDVSIDTPGRATARGFTVADIRFDNVQNRTGIGLRFRSADGFLVDNCEFWGFDRGIELGEVGQPLTQVLIQNSFFLFNNRGIRSIAPAPPTIALIRVIGNTFGQNGVDDPAGPGGCCIIQGGASHVVSGNRFEDNLGRGVKLHDTKYTVVESNYFEDNNQGNLVVTGASTKKVIIMPTNSFDAAGYILNPEVQDNVEFVCVSSH